MSVRLKQAKSLKVLDQFSDDEAAEAQRCIAQAYKILDQVDLDYRPKWLLNDWPAHTWMTFAGNKTRQVDGEWLGTANVNWNVLLPNGARLTDKRYSRLLQTCRSVCALYRDGVAGGAPPAISTWLSFCREIRRLCIWCVLNEKTFRPETHGLSLIDHSSLTRLFNALARGGWTDALLICERVVGVLYMRARGSGCPSDYLERLWALPDSVRDEICHWLAENNGYAKHPSSRGRVSRHFLASLINCDVRSAVRASPKLNAVIRQFEPLHQDENGLLLSISATEYPSQRSVTIEDACVRPMSESCVGALCRALTSLLELHTQFPELLPDPSGISLRKLMRSANRIAAPDRHTPFIPIPIGLKYLGEALRWVDEYGDELVDFYLEVARGMRQVGPGPRQKATGIRRQQRLISQIGIPPGLARLGGGLCRVYPNQSRNMDFDAFRSQPTLHQALECLIGAVVISIGMLKPARSSEIAHAPRDCLYGDGPYWIETELAKSGAKEFREKSDAKPIPNITARAIKQIQRLGRGLAEIYEERDPYLRSRLFYLPSKNFGHAKAVTDDLLDYYLNRFCDYVGMPLDPMGRRWYVRVHEMRKWFLLLFVWSGRFNVLDAARYVAGHTSQEHLQAYIEREEPHESLIEIECEYAADRLRQFEGGSRELDETGLNELYEAILRRFNVSSLEMISERTWEPYLSQLIESKEFAIEPYLVRNDSDVRICVAFRSRRAT